MCSDDDTHRWVGCPIRISTDQSLLAAPHGFSQRATSFIASWCQGIHRMPFSRSQQHAKSLARPASHHAREPATHAQRTNPQAHASHPLAQSLTHTLGAPERDADDARSDRHHPTPKERTRTDSIANEQRHAERSQPTGHVDLLSSATTTDPTPSPATTSARARTGSAEMETIGIEPMTPCLQSRCSPS